MTAQPPQRRRRSVWYRVLSVIVFTLIPVAGFCDQTPQTQPATAPGDVLISQPNWLIRQSALCDAALLRAETRYQLPHQLLTSIARVESGRPITSLADTRPWPWTIDADGMGLFVDSKAAAIAWMTTQAAHHNFVDVGCMQVDLLLPPTRLRLAGGSLRPRCERRLCGSASPGVVSRRGGRELGSGCRPLSFAHVAAGRRIPGPRRHGRRRRAARDPPGPCRFTFGQSTKARYGYSSPTERLRCSTCTGSRRGDRRIRTAHARSSRSLVRIWLVHGVAPAVQVRRRAPPQLSKQTPRVSVARSQTAQ